MKYYYGCTVDMETGRIDYENFWYKDRAQWLFNKEHDMQPTMDEGANKIWVYIELESEEE